MISFKYFILTIFWIEVLVSSVFTLTNLFQTEKIPLLQTLKKQELNLVFTFLKIYPIRKI